eukprot:6099007-Pleurochrysis_carterae.AAC.1
MWACVRRGDGEYARVYARVHARERVRAYMRQASIPYVHTDNTTYSLVHAALQSHRVHQSAPARLQR